MRDIRFRAWDTILNKMLDMKEIERTGMNLFSLCEGSKLVKLMQYTGLKDKNGKEIYEYDLFQYGRDTGVIKYREGEFYIDWRPPVTWGLTSRLADKYSEGEVFGNVWEEHPHLLGGAAIKALQGEDTQCGK